MSRVGNFSSSEIWKLIPSGKRPMTQEELDARPKKGKGSSTTLVDDPTTFSETGLTYIQEKRLELKLGRSLETQTHSRPTSWGHLLEPIAFERIQKLGDVWKLVSTERLTHPTISNWTGIPDLICDLDIANNDVGDIKCPFTLKSFCELSEISTGEELKEHSPEYYWQLVSNAILRGTNQASLFVYCPYRGDLHKVRGSAAMNDIEWLKVDWINYASDYELPYLILGSDYNDLHEINFQIPKSDLDLLEIKVKSAIKVIFQ